ncbi:MAG: TIGR03087 family PEP-CTERM/XrtA system glycosyltransferase [Pseudomonadota bacterium]
MANLLFLTQRIPYPPNKGEKIRVLQVLQHLRKSHDIHLGCLVDDPHDVRHIETVRAMCATAHFAQIDRRRAKIACLSGLLTGEALSVVFYRDRGLARWVRQVVRDIKPEIIVVCSSNMAPYILDLRETLPAIRLIDVVDIDSEKWRSYADVASFPMRQVYRREWKCVAELEDRIVRECDWSTFVSDAEADLFRKDHMQYSNRIRGISNGVDLDYFSPAHMFEPPYPLDKPNFVFTGTMDYPPNVDAVVWFAREILPLIRRTVPAAQFHVVGASPSPKVEALTSIPGVFVTGRVPDVRAYVAHADACVAPMRIARGIQNKVLEAMAMGRPTVVTGDALEGIHAVPGTELLLANTAEDFARACLSAAGLSGAALGTAARQRVVRDYAWPALLGQFDQLLNQGKAAPVL